MRAIFIERFGPPETLREREIPAPVPEARQVTIRVAAAGVNFADLLQRMRLYGNAPQIPYIPGFEVAGHVEATGSDVQLLKAGDRVVALTSFGGYATQVCVPEEQAWEVPKEISLRHAAALPVNYLTAWFCLYHMGQARRGDRVLIHSGAGGVGSAAVQLAVGTGCEVFATAGSSAKMALLQSLGVSRAIDHSREDFVAVVRKMTSDQGVDLALDSVGGDTLRKSYELLAPLGRLVSYGLSAAAPDYRRRPLRALLALWKTPSFKPLSLIGRNVGVFGFHLGLLESRRTEIIGAFEQILDLTATRRVTPVIDQSYPLTAAGAAAAHRRLHDRANLGKVLLTAREDSS